MPLPALRRLPGPSISPLQVSSVPPAVLTVLVAIRYWSRRRRTATHCLLWCQSRLAPVLTGLIRRSLSGVGWKGLGSPFRSMPLRILVVGAGVGGISVARGLLRDGHDVTVFEQRPDARAGGGAVTIWSNGATVLEQLGVDMDGAGQLLSTVRVVTSDRSPARHLGPDRDRGPAGRACPDGPASSAA